MRERTNMLPDATNVLVAGTYRLNKKMVSGTFSDIYFGEIEKVKTPVAIKLESTKNDALQKLHIEYSAYERLKAEKGIPTIYFFGKHDDLYNVLVMQQLDLNLEQLFQLCQRNFSMKTILYITIQLLSRFEAIHRKGLLYRDVKPENFLIGKRQEKHLIYVVDFAFSKPYIDPDTGKHIKNERRSSTMLDLIGSARYKSLNVHQGEEYSRRDDLESLGYMIMYYLKHGKLPWSGLTRYTNDRERFEKIFEYKTFTPIEKLCDGHPNEFAGYFRYVRSLEFDQEPCYQYLQGLFVGRFQAEGFQDDGQYDWSSKVL